MYFLKFWEVLFTDTYLIPSHALCVNFTARFRFWRVLVGKGWNSAVWWKWVHCLFPAVTQLIFQYCCVKTCKDHPLGLLNKQAYALS